MSEFVQNIRYGWRRLRKNPTFTVVAVFTLALGIGATTAIFSVVYGVLLRPLPYANPEQIVRMWERNNEWAHTNFADPNFEDLRSDNHSLQGMAEYRNSVDTVSVGGEPSRAMVARVSRDFLLVMGIQPVVGRGFVPDEQRTDAAPAALVSYSYWKQTLGSARDFSTLRVKIGAQPVSIIGVLPPGFRFPEKTELWLPREIGRRDVSRTAHNWQVIGRLRDGYIVATARTELSGIAQRLKKQYGQDTSMIGVTVEPLREAMTSDVRPVLWIILMASGLLLLIACANVVNLMLAQAAAHQRDLSIRTALGATRRRLFAQVLTESFLLSSAGGVLGILLASVGLRSLLALAPPNLPRLENVSIDVPVLVFSLVTIFLVSTTLGLLTAWRAVSSDPGSGLSDASRGQVGTARGQRAGRFAAAGQLATALVLLVSAALLGRSLLRVLSTDAGFRMDRVLTMELRPPETPDNLQRVEFLNQLLAQLRGIPGVEEVGGINDLPLVEGGRADGTYVVMNPSQVSPRMQELIERSGKADFDKNPELLRDMTTFFEDLMRDRAHLGDADFAVVSEGFFKTLSIPLVRGRLFNDNDTMDAAHVAVVSESLAKEKWPNQDPIGRTVEFGNMDGDLRLLTIVGVVGDIRDHSLESAPHPTVYVNYRQRPRGAWRFAVVMRASGQAEGIFSAARRIVHNLDPGIPPEFRTLSQVYSNSLEARRFSVTLVGIFSAAALLLALAGIYGVISYSVAQRTREIGVRMALGASAREVLRMVLKQGVLIGAIGVAAGILGSLALTRWMRAQLFEISSTDPATFVGAAFLLAAVALLACWVPARRAAKVDPMVALRYE